MKPSGFPMHSKTASGGGEANIALSYLTLELTFESLARIAQLAKENGYQLAVHAIGDLANSKTLDIFEKTIGKDSRQDHLGQPAAGFNPQ